MTHLKAFYAPEVQREYEAQKPYWGANTLGPSQNTSCRPHSLPRGVRRMLGALITLACALYAAGWLWEVTAQ